MPDRAGLAAKVNLWGVMGPVTPVALAGTRCLSVTVAPAAPGRVVPRAASAATADCCMETEAVAD